MARGLYIGSRIVWQSTPDLSLETGTAREVAIAPNLYNPRGKSAAYSFVGTPPSGCSISGSSFVWNGLGAEFSGSVAIRATTAQYEVDLTVPITITTPTFSWDTIPSQSLVVGQPFVLSLSDYAPAGTETYGVASGDALPSGLFLNTSTGDVTGTPTTAQVLSPSFTATIADASDAETDWQSRISGTGVVWYHDFRNDDEVDLFRWANGYSSGNDPLGASTLGGNVRRITSDTIIPGSGCLEVYHPVGTADGIHWWRPLNPFVAGSNGRTTDDPAANGTITKRTWSPTNGGNQTSVWSYGWYGYPGNGSATKEGHDFYMQVRVKMDPNRITGGNASNTIGKFVWFTICQYSLSDGELVTYSYGAGGDQGTGKNYFRLYHTNVVGQGYFDPLNPGSDIQPGGVTPNFYYSGGWDTLLYHVRPGANGVTSGAAATFLEVWAAKPGETSYTKIWEQTYGINAWENGGGPQALMFSAYNNGNNFPQAFYHRYGQVIFSKETIPIPDDPVQRGEV